MKIVKTVVLVVSVLFCGIMSNGADSNTSESPTTLDNAMLSITASDLHGLFEGAGSVAANISPMMNGIMLKSMLGGQFLGDAQLAGIAHGKGLAIVVVNPSNIFAVVEASGPQLSIYTNKLTTMGMHSQENDGVLVVGHTSNDVITGIKYVSDVKRKLLNKRCPSIRLSLNPAAIVKKNNDIIDSMLKKMNSAITMMPTNAPTQYQQPKDVENIMEAEARILLSIMKQIEAAEITLLPSNGSITMTEVFVPEKGSGLAKFINAPAINKWNKKLQANALGDGTFKFEFLLKNTKAMSEFISSEAENLIAEMKLNKAKIKPFVDLMLKYVDACGGTVCESVNMGGKNLISANCLVEINDKAQILQLLRDSESNLKNTGITDFYHNMGMDMSIALTENVGEYMGVKIHNLATKIDMKNIPKEQLQMYQSMNFTNMQSKVAIFDDILAFAVNNQNIDKLIDIQKNPSFAAEPLDARQLTKDGSCYMDFDVAGYLDFISSMMPTNIPGMPDLTQMSTLLKGAAKITSTGYSKNGMLIHKAKIPGSLITRVGQMFMMLAMQTQQQAHAVQKP